MSKVVRFPRLKDMPEGKVVVLKKPGSLKITYSFGATYNRKHDWLVREAIHIAETEIWRALEATKEELFARIIGLGR